MDTSEWLALGALAASLLAIGISVVAIVTQKHMNTINLQATYYEQIFKQYFLVRIPDAAEKLEYEQDGRLSKEYRELNKVFLNMMKDCRYFAYANNGFYRGLKERVQNLEEKLIDEASHIENDIDKRMMFIYSIHQDIMRIIKEINKHYTNTK